MSQVKGERIQEVSELGGVWHFATGGADHLGVVGETKQGFALSVFTARSGRWQRVNSVPLARPVHASDALLVGSELLFCSEKNSWEAIEVERWSAADFVAGKKVYPTLAGHAGLSELQSAKVNLPPSAQWAVITGLRPASWLFSPRWVRGGPPLLVANTADRQAMLFAIGSGRRSRLEPTAPSPPRESEAFAVAGARGPQGVVWQGHRHVAFRLEEGALGPASSLTPGGLAVKEDDAAPLDLSRQLQLGEVTSFSLTEGPGGAPWIFAARQAVAGSEVFAIAREGSRWVLKEKKPVDHVIQEITAWRRGDAWHLAYATREDDGWSVWVLPW